MASKSVEKELTTREVSEKVTRYEHFINEVLRADLAKVHATHAEAHKQLMKHESVKQFIEQLVNGTYPVDKPLKVQTDMGCNFYVQAVV